jgi:tetratricopeptide (TPR) repeat protein
MEKLSREGATIYVDALDFMGQFSDSPDGNWIVSWGLRTSETKPKNAHWILGYKNVLMLSRSVSCEILDGVVNNNGIFGLILNTYPSSLSVYTNIGAKIGTVRAETWYPSSMALSDDGQLACLFNRNEEITLLDVKNGKPLWFHQIEDFVEIERVGFSADRKSVVVYGVNNKTQLLPIKGDVYETQRSAFDRYLEAVRTFRLRINPPRELVEHLLSEVKDIIRSADSTQFGSLSSAWMHIAEMEHALGNYLDADEAEKTARKMRSSGEIIYRTRKKFKNKETTVTKGDIDEFMRDIQRAIQISKDNDELAQGYRLMGEIYEYLQELDSTMACYEKALNFNPRIGLKRKLQKMRDIPFSDN